MVVMIVVNAMAIKAIGFNMSNVVLSALVAAMVVIFTISQYFVA